MAIHIQLKKVEEGVESVVYAFGSAEEMVGKFVFVKASGELELTELDEQVRQVEWYLSRIRPVLDGFRAKGAYPDDTTYAP